jgi:hypothetical protein
VATKPRRDVDGVGSWMIEPCTIYLALFHSPSLPSFCAPCGIMVAKIFTVPLPFPGPGILKPAEIAIPHSIPRMSILLALLRHPAVLASACPSASINARSHEIGLPRPLARIVAVPFAKHNRTAARRRAAAGARGAFQSRNLVKHASDPAVFASLHSAAAAERRARRGEMRRASQENERSHSMAGA